MTDFEIKFAGDYGEVSFDSTALAPDPVYKAGSLNIHMKSNEPTTGNVLLHLNDTTRAIDIGDVGMVYHSSRMLFGGYVVNIRINTARKIVDLSLGDPLVLLESQKLVFDDPVIPDTDDVNDDETNNVVESGGTYTTTLTTSTPLVEPLVQVYTLDARSMETDDFVQSGCGSYATISDDHGGNTEVGRQKFIGKNSKCKSLAVKLEGVSGTRNAKVYIEDIENSNDVWTSSTITPALGVAGWEIMSVDTRLEGGRLYGIRIEADTAAASTIRWYGTTSIKSPCSGMSSNGGAYDEYWNNDGAGHNIRTSFNYELEFECDWFPKYEGRHYTVDYDTKVITWGGYEGFVPSFNSKIRENTLGSDYDIARVSYLEEGLNSRNAIEHIMNSYGRDIFKYMDLDSSKAKLWETTARFDEWDKDVVNESHRSETYTDNPSLAEDQLQLGNYHGSNFNVTSTDATNFKWTSGFVRNYTDDGGSTWNINHASHTGEIWIDCTALNPGDCEAGVWSNNALTGDFDIKIKMTDATIPSAGLVIFGVIKDRTLDDDHCYIGFDDSQISGQYMWNGSSSGTTAACSDSTQWFKITRSGTTVKSYYGGTDGLNWDELQSSTNGDTDDLYIFMSVSASDGENNEGRWDDYIVTSGTFANNDYQTAADPKVTVTNVADIAELVIEYSGVDANNKLKVKILDASDDSEDWASAFITSGTSQTYDTGDFGTITHDFKINVEFTGDGTTSPSVTKVQVRMTANNGQNWNQYIMSQTSVLAACKDLASMDWIDFHSKFHNPSYDFDFVVETQLVPDDWDEVYTTAQQDQRTFTTTAGSTDSQMKIKDHFLTRSYLGKIKDLKTYKPGRSKNFYTFPNKANIGEPTINGPMIGFHGGMHSESDFTSTCTDLVDSSYAGEEYLSEVTLHYVEADAEEVFFKCNELYKIIDAHSNLGSGKVFKVLQIDYDFTDTWTVRVIGTDNPKQIKDALPPDMLDRLHDYEMESHSIFDPSTQGYKILTDNFKGAMMTQDQTYNLPGYTPKFEKIFHDQKMEEHHLDCEKYLEETVVTDYDYTWDLGSGNVWIAIGDDDSSPGTDAMQNELARVQGTYFSYSDPNGDGVKIIRAEFTKDDLSVSSFPYTIKEFGLYDAASGGNCKSRQVYWQPDSDENIDDDQPSDTQYNAFKIFFSNTKLMVQYNVDE